MRGPFKQSIFKHLFWHGRLPNPSLLAAVAERADYIRASGVTMTGDELILWLRADGSSPTPETEPTKAEPEA